MSQETAQQNDHIDSERLSNELRLFTEEIDNDVMELLRCDEILSDELGDELDEDSTEEEMMYEMMDRPDFGHCAMNPGFDECFCNAGVLWDEDSIWSFPHGFLERDRVHEPANVDTEIVGNSCAVLFWGW